MASHAACAGLYATLREELRAEIRNSLQRRVLAASTLVDPAVHRGLTSRSQENSEAYRRALAPLRRFQQANDDVRYVSTFVLRDGRVYFVLDPTDSGDRDGDGLDEKSHIMQPYEDASPGVYDTLLTGRPHTDPEPRWDAWGAFMGAYAPIRDETGRTVAAIGIDLAATDLENRLDQARAMYRRTLVVSGLIALVVGGAAFRLFRWFAMSAERLDGTRLVAAQRELLEDAVQNPNTSEVLALICRRAEAICERGSVAIQIGDTIAAGTIDPRGEIWTSPSADARQGVRLVHSIAERRGSTPRERHALTAFAHVASVALREAEAREAMTQARDRALTTTRAKSEFLASMSHEIRTPMSGLIGMTELLRETDLTPNQRECVETILGNSEALLRLIDDILSLAKLEAGRVTLEAVPFDLAGRIEAIAARHAAAIPPGVTLTAEIAPEARGRFVGDPARVGQVVDHLVGNAVKFTKAGSIVLRVEEIDEGVRIVVRDTGCGIPAERLAAVFDPFTQADGSSTRRFGGTGLGLTVCRRLMNLMNGSLSLATEEGRGTEFTVELPLPRSVE